MHSIYSKLLLTVLLFLIATESSFAQADTIRKSSFWNYLKRPEQTNSPSIGIAIGTDIGGAVPVPISAIGTDMQAFPKLHLSLGGKITFPLKKGFSLITEITYKQIEMTANARVINQKATLDDGKMVQYFSGTVRSSMSFDILEIPILTRYQLGDSRHSFIGGVYGAWIGSASFLNSPMKGFIGKSPDIVTDPINSPSPGTDMEFSPNLRSWDTGIILGYENQIIPRLTLGIRVGFGFIDIFDTGRSPLEYPMKHIRGTAVIAYDLFFFKKR